MSLGPWVVKVGGSLYDLPELGQRLNAWLVRQTCQEVLLVPGGGAAANLVRDLDRLNGLGEETGHRLALRSLTFTAHLVAALLGQNGVVIADPTRASDVWQEKRLPILDLGAFALADSGLPHTWAVTSDSLAARVAHLLGSRTLVLLKSVTIPAGMSWEEAARRGDVDAYFPNLADSLTVRTVNLRQEPRITFPATPKP